ncbi:MAG: S-layer homology domain-containing protein [Ignavibacteriales bacterium]
MFVCQPFIYQREGGLSCCYHRLLPFTPCYGLYSTLVKEGLIAGSGDTINPRANATRAEAAVFLCRIYNKYRTKK